MEDRSVDRVNELEAYLANPDSQHGEIDALNELAWELRVRDPERAAVLCQKAWELSQSGEYSLKPYVRGQVASMAARAFMDTYAGELDVAFSQCLQAISMLESSHPDIEIRVWFTLCWNSFFLGDYPAALENGIKALNLAREIGDHLHEAWALDAVASLHGITGDFETAVQLHQDALNIFRKLSDVFGELRTLNNLAVSLSEMKQFERAYEAGEKSLQLAKDLGLEMDICNNSCTVADILIEMDRLDEAEAYLKESMSGFFHGSSVAHVNVLERMGRVHLLKNDLQQAELFAGRALDLARKLNQRAEQALCHRILTEIYEQKSQLGKALNHYKKFHELHLVTQGEQAEKRLAVLKITHQVESARYAAEIYHLEAVELQHKVEEQKRIQNILEFQNTIDPLTELHNRRSFDDILTREYSRHSRSGADLSLLMLDVDYFKLFNDTYGHVRGDDCLRQVAQVIRNAITRPPDMAVRYGGEEFVCLLPETNLNGAKHVAENIRLGVANLEIPHSGSDAAKVVTVSIGLVSAKCTKGGDAMDILVKADKRLYLAKARGRNRIEAMRA